MKYDYFAALEALAGDLAEGAAQFARTAHIAAPSRGILDSMLDRGIAADRRVCEMENALIADFLPPIDRADLITAAHALRESIWSLYDACYLQTGPRQTTDPSPQAQATAIAETVSLLRRRKEAAARPHTAELYRQYALARRHRAEDHAPLSPLYAALNTCYDTLVEIFLRNL